MGMLSRVIVAGAECCSNTAATFSRLLQGCPRCRHPAFADDRGSFMGTLSLLHWLVLSSYCDSHVFRGEHDGQRTLVSLHSNVVNVCSVIVPLKLTCREGLPPLEWCSRRPGGVLEVLEEASLSSGRGIDGRFFQ